MEYHAGAIRQLRRSIAIHNLEKTTSTKFTNSFGHGFAKTERIPQLAHIKRILTGGVSSVEFVVFSYTVRRQPTLLDPDDNHMVAVAARNRMKSQRWQPRFDVVRKKLL